ncbi:hypothetical protein EGR_10102 [Echinococcus granulosus]|uniref:Uncharacterized protein n=1 Tax=Echinococcus granulosus TaxID=6210 RepID=W6U1Q7_ECHGR|nr:hypothetical protein EGR_10102 [Echinococcus granulosus]EUB55030.1 hypothetical protein EGR_10102 [Echinococcus granulosus]
MEFTFVYEVHRLSGALQALASSNSASFVIQPTGVKCHSNSEGVDIPIHKIRTSRITIASS